jgi:hypothetical protein
MKQGFDKKRAARYRERMSLYWKNTPISFSKKLWAAKRGFFADKVELYGLTESNYKDYLSDYDRLWLHPMNNHFAFWINDKITLKYMLQKPFIIEGVEYDVMPEYYLYIENDGHYTYLMDSPSEISHDKDYLFNLLKLKKELAVKLTNGEKGKGFYKLQYIDGVVFSNGEPMEEDFSDFEKSLKGYVITEYCHQHSDLQQVWDKSECTLRVVTTRSINDRYSSKSATGGGINVIVSYARFGSSLSGGASNLSQGGVGIPFDFESGIYGQNFMRYKEFCSDGCTAFPSHPDSNCCLSGKRLPNWDIVKKAIYAVCDHLASLEMLGLDIIITQNGLKLCEINSLPAFDYEQVMCGPLMKNEAAAKFFNAKKQKKIKK